MNNNRGERIKTSKLKERDVLRIREMLILGITKADIARKYKVTPASIRKIEVNSSWRHVE